jgi:hypothetical protein
LVISTAATLEMICVSSSFLVTLRKGSQMLQWKPRFYAVLTLAALAVAVFGGYAGESAGDTLRQFGW